MTTTNPITSSPKKKVHVNTRVSGERSSRGDGVCVEWETMASKQLMKNKQTNNLGEYRFDNAHRREQRLDFRNSLIMAIYHGWTCSTYNI